MKFEFDTNDDGDKYDLISIQNANKYRRLLNEIFIKIRKKVKYGDASKGNWEEVYNLIWDLAGEEHIDPWEEIY